METILKRKWIIILSLTILISGCGQESGRESTREVAGERGLEGNSDVPLLQGNSKTLVEGDNLEFDSATNLLCHTWVKDSRIIYQANYRNKKKISNKLLPWIQDSFLFEDKYYLKVYFPFPYDGNMNIKLENDPEYVLTPIEDQKYQVVINHALDLNRVDFSFHYQPTDADTLVETRFSYSYVIMEGEK